MNDFMNKPFCSQRLFEARRSLSKSSNLRDELDFQSAHKLWSEIEGLSIRMSMSRIPRQHLVTVADAREHVQASPPIKTATGEGNRQITALLYCTRSRTPPADRPLPCTKRASIFFR